MVLVDRSIAQKIRLGRSIRKSTSLSNKENVINPEFSRKFITYVLLC